MVQKLLATLAIVFYCLCWVDSAQGKSANLRDTHNIYQCPDSSIIATSPLCQLNIQESANFLNYVTKTVKCPESGVNKDKIVCIIVKDNIDNDEGGYASITSGGLDQYYVEISLKSQFSKGINFHIEIYTEAASTATTTTSSSLKMY